METVRSGVYSSDGNAVCISRRASTLLYVILYETCNLKRTHETLSCCVHTVSYQGGEGEPALLPRHAEA